jgi:hypothetical protein
MKNIHLIPTDKPSRLYKSKITQNIFICNIISQYGDATYNQHIYITSDEEIKEGDWVVKISSLYKGGDIAQKYSFIDTQFEDITFKKIILTTDQELIADGVQAIDDEFLEWFVKNPTCEFVEVNEKLIIIQDKPLVQHQGNKPIVVPHRINYKIIIPSEPKSIDCGNKNCQGGVINGLNPRLCKKCNPQKKPKQETELSAYYRNGIGGAKQETLEEAVNNFKKTDVYINEIKQKQDKKLYSEEEVEVIAKDAYAMGRNNILIGVFNKWFEQFKKK